MWAVGRVPIGAGGRVERRRILLDRTIAFLGCGTVLWHFGLAPMLTAGSGERPGRVLVGLAFLLAVAGINQGVVHRRRSGRSHRHPADALMG